MKKAPEIVPASEAMLKDLGEYAGRGGRAFAAVLDGKVLGVAGYHHDRNRVVLYSEVTEELRPWKKIIVRGAHLAVLASLRVNAPAVALAKTSAAVRILEAYGFVHVEDDLYWRNPWQPQPQ